MADTAVGLFEHSGTAEAVVDALRANAVPSNRIRVLSRPVALLVEDAMGTPSIDFIVSLSRDLRSMGASDAECKAYVDGVQKGNVLIFASGSRVQAEAAIAIMNEYDPLEIEEFAGAVPALSGMRADGVGPHGVGPKSERARSEGARIFTW